MRSLRLLRRLFTAKPDPSRIQSINFRYKDYIKNFGKPSVQEFSSDPNQKRSSLAENVLLDIEKGLEDPPKLRETELEMANSHIIRLLRVPPEELSDSKSSDIILKLMDRIWGAAHLLTNKKLFLHSFFLACRQEALYPPGLLNYLSFAENSFADFEKTDFSTFVSALAILRERSALFDEHRNEIFSTLTKLANSSLLAIDSGKLKANEACELHTMLRSIGFEDENYFENIEMKLVEGLRIFNFETCIFLFRVLGEGPSTTARKLAIEKLALAAKDNVGGLTSSSLLALASGLAREQQRNPKPILIETIRLILAKLIQMGGLDSKPIDYLASFSLIKPILEPQEWGRLRRLAEQSLRSGAAGSPLPAIDLLYDLACTGPTKVEQDLVESLVSSIFSLPPQSLIKLVFAFKKLDLPAFSVVAKKTIEASTPRLQSIIKINSKLIAPKVAKDYFPLFSLCGDQVTEDFEKVCLSFVDHFAERLEIDDIAVIVEHTSERPEWISAHQNLLTQFTNIAAYLAKAASIEPTSRSLKDQLALEQSNPYDLVAAISAFAKATPHSPALAIAIAASRFEILRLLTQFTEDDILRFSIACFNDTVIEKLYIEDKAALGAILHGVFVRLESMRISSLVLLQKLMLQSDVFATRYPKLLEHLILLLKKRLEQIPSDHTKNDLRKS